MKNIDVSGVSYDGQPVCIPNQTNLTPISVDDQISTGKIINFLNYYSENICLCFYFL